MKKLTTLYNGNFFPEWDAPEHLPRVPLPEGAKADYHAPNQHAVLNNTDAPIKLRSGYRTTANGDADELILPPNCIIFRSYKGNPYSFSEYEIWGESE